MENELTRMNNCNLYDSCDLNLLCASSSGFKKLFHFALLIPNTMHCFIFIEKLQERRKNRKWYVLCVIRNTTYLLLALKWILWSKCNFALYLFSPLFLLKKIWIGTRVIVSCFKFEWNELWMHTMNVEHWIPFKFGESHTITINTIE